jgi:diacylglycerol kinase family enzyme
MLAVFFNPVAGRTERRDLHSQLAALFAAVSLPVQLIALDSPETAPERVRSAIASGARVVVAAGGDGTVSSIASVLLETPTALGVIPLGTLNHFAKDLAIPLDMGQAVRTIASEHVVRVDVGDVNGRAFLNNSSIGVYPNIVIERETLRQQGYRKWTAFVIATARVLARYRGIIIQMKVLDSTKIVQTPFVFVGNNEYEIEGRRLGRRQRIDAGRLFVYVAPRLHTRDLPVLAARALAGRVSEAPVLESLAVETLEIDAPGRNHLRVALDGEVELMRLPLRCCVRPSALRVIVPIKSTCSSSDPTHHP